jgi:hypothetical protein
MDAREFEKRTKAFAIRCLKLVGMLKKSLVHDLGQQAHELLMIFSKSRRSSRTKQITK